MINHLVLHRFCMAKYIMSIATQFIKVNSTIIIRNLEYIRPEIFKDTGTKQNLKVMANR